MSKRIHRSRSMSTVTLTVRRIDAGLYKPPSLQQFKNDTFSNGVMIVKDSQVVVEVKNTMDEEDQSGSQFPAGAVADSSSSGQAYLGREERSHPPEPPSSLHLPPAKTVQHFEEIGVPVMDGDLLPDLTHLPECSVDGLVETPTDFPVYQWETPMGDSKKKSPAWRSHFSGRKRANNLNPNKEGKDNSRGKCLCM